jgi:hypothetical protein
MYNHTSVLSSGCCAKYSVSFHYVEDLETRFSATFCILIIAIVVVVVVLATQSGHSLSRHGSILLHQVLLQDSA